MSTIAPKLRNFCDKLWQQLCQRWKELKIQIILNISSKLDNNLLDHVMRDTDLIANIKLQKTVSD